ncbi:hypothetical protein FQN57_002305 [Myotisia sp. PD_48]|nr:hypothetical protein FQN57_002305 [Myotisia sp. PD_48]
MASSHNQQQNGIVDEDVSIESPPRDPTKTGPDTDEHSEDGAGERPVRQKLKETSIASSCAEITGNQSNDQDGPIPSQERENTNESGNGREESGGSPAERGRLKKKRSRDDLGNEDGQTDQDDEIGHRRKRSRSSKAENSPDPESQIDQVSGPKKKRSRDQFDKDHDLKVGDQVRDEKKLDTELPKDDGVDPDSQTTSASLINRTAEGEPEKKRHRDDSQEREAENGGISNPSQVNPFSSISTASPFAALNKPRSNSTAKEEEKPSTSPSAFAASGLAAFASSESSPFGATGGSPSVFAPKNGNKPIGGTSSTGLNPSPFAAAAGSSPFASTFPSGGLGGTSFSSGFGATGSRPGGRLTSFASASPSAFGSTTFKSKPFGASADEAEDVEKGENSAQHKQTTGLEEAKQDERFSKQETETGEEGEETRFSCRGKLFHFIGGEWKERGIGTFKLNVTELVSTGSSGESEKSATGNSKKAARFLMRTDGVFRLILNVPLYKGMKVGSAAGDEPTQKAIHISAFEDGKCIPLLIRTSNLQTAKELYTTAHDILNQL